MKKYLEARMKFKTIIFLIVFVLSAQLYSCSSVENINKETEVIKNGLYCSRDMNVYCIVDNGSITITRILDASEVSDKSIISDVYNYELVNGSYVCENVRNKVSFKLHDEILTMIINQKTYELRKKTIVESYNDSNKLPKINIEDIVIRSFQVYWEPNIKENYYPYDCGILNVCVEVLKEGNKDYNLIKILDFEPAPVSNFYLNLRDLKLDNGKYLMKMKYGGGNYLKDDKLFKSIDSDPIYLSILVDNGYENVEFINEDDYEI